MKLNSQARSTLTTKESPTYLVAKHMLQVLEVAKAIETGFLEEGVNLTNQLDIVVPKVDVITRVAHIARYLDALEEHLETILSVAESLNEISSVSNALEAIRRLHSRIHDLIKVADNIEAVKYVGAHGELIGQVVEAIPDIATVLSHMECIHWNAENAAMWERVFSNLDSLISVGENIDILESLVDVLKPLLDLVSNIEIILDEVAKSNEYMNMARKWAEEAPDVPVVIGSYSAKHWAEKAKQLTSVVTEVGKPEVISVSGNQTEVTLNKIPADKAVVYISGMNVSGMTLIEGIHYTVVGERQLKLKTTLPSDTYLLVQQGMWV